MNGVLSNAVGQPMPSRPSIDNRADRVSTKSSRTIPTLRPMGHLAKSNMAPNPLSRSFTDRPTFNSARSRLHSAPVLGNAAETNKRPSGGNVSSSACDSSTHSIKSSLTASTTTTNTSTSSSGTTTNYILRNKLQVKEPKLRKTPTVRTDSNSNVSCPPTSRPIVSKINTTMGPNVTTRSRPIITRINAQDFLNTNCNKKESSLRGRKVNHSVPPVSFASTQHDRNCQFSKSSQSMAKISFKPLTTNCHNTSSETELKLLLDDAKLAAAATCDETTDQTSPDVTTISKDSLQIAKPTPSQPTSEILSLQANSYSNGVIQDFLMRTPESSSSCDTNSSRVISDKSQLSKPIIKMATSPVKLQSKPDKKFDNLLRFIEISSSEFLFLLNKSAKLSYRISLFEQKLDYLEKIFVKQDHDSGKLRTDLEVSQRWTKVIERTRRWLDKAREKNPFLTKVSLKQQVLKATESKRKLLQQIRDMSTEQRRQLEERRQNQNEVISLSSNDELIVLLDRIAQFSSNIISKCKIDQSPSKSSLSPHDSILNDRSDEADSCVEDSNDILSRLMENSSKCDEKPDFSFVKMLQPEVVKALIELAKTETRLNNVQHELDLLMCAHLKSYGEFLGQTKEPLETEFNGTSLPVPLSFKQVNSQMQEALGGKSSGRYGHSSQQHRTARTVEHQTQCTMHGTDAMIDSKHSNGCNFASDGDSGGEFTVTTVTNEFSPCSAEDELSSLLNQIALCSQKIIEHSTGTSSNSTISSGCCCSTSIEAKCSGGCSVGQSRLLHKDFLPYSSEYQNQSAFSTSNLPSASFHKSVCCMQCSPISDQTTGSNLRSHVTYHNLNQLAESTYLKRNSISGSHGCRHTHPAAMSSSMAGHRLSLNRPYDGDYIHASANGTSSHNRLLSANQAKFAKRIRETDWPMKEPFVDCISNNVTGFMLSSSMVDLLGHPHHSPRCYHGAEKTYELVDCPNDTTLNPASAFIFDPNVDVENFLQEVERELDDNCYTSAPPFMSSCNEEHHLHYRNGSMEHSHRCGQPPTVPYSSSCSSHLVTGPVIAGATALGSLHSETRNCMSHCSNYVSGEGGSIPHSPLAGSNWRLSQRNLIVDRDLGEMMSPSNYFPFPATASMPNGCSQSPGQCDQYKRLIGSSSWSDLLEKYRSQATSRVTQETERQLREIDHWLHEQLVQCGSIRTDGSERDTSEPTTAQFD